MPILNKKKLLKSSDYNINENVKIKSKLFFLSDEIFNYIKLIHKTLRFKKEFLICGNGVGKYKKIKKAINQLIFPSKNIARIQEIHLFLGHFVLNEVEKLLLSD